MIKHDVVIVGSGLAGMRCAVELRRRAPAADIAIVTKLYPTRAPSGVAQAGIPAALPRTRQAPGGPEAPDDSWQAHMQDSVRAGEFLGDEAALEILCREAAEVVYELEHMGVPFNRQADGRLARRRYSGHAQPRSCYVADRTGHAVLQTLYGELVRYKIRVYPEWYMLGLALEDGACRGITALDIRTGAIELLQARATVLATGGLGNLYARSSDALSSTGDGLSAAYRAGLQLADMEFVQFHPAGLGPQGLLFAEGAFAEGAQLLNSQGERFMARYAPAELELAAPQLLSQACAAEIAAGRGAGPQGDHVLLDLRPIGGATLRERLPRALELAHDYLGLDPLNDPVPVSPTVHALLGGIPSDLDGRVLLTHNAQDRIVAGLFAAGACACLSLHGASRLAGNGLLEALVFGRRAGQTIAEFLAGGAELLPVPDYVLEEAQAEVEELLTSSGDQLVAQIRQELQASMLANCGLQRTPDRLEQQIGLIHDLRERFGRIALDDKGRRFNTELVEALELARMLDQAEVIVGSALAREESRGSHARVDYPQRDDQQWRKHTLAQRDPTGHLQLSSRPLRFGSEGERFQPA